MIKHVVILCVVGLFVSGCMTSTPVTQYKVNTKPYTINGKTYPYRPHYAEVKRLIIDNKTCYYWNRDMDYEKALWKNDNLTCKA